MNYTRINTVFAKALIAGKSRLFEIFLLICIERPELPDFTIYNYIYIIYIYIIYIYIYIYIIILVCFQITIIL